MKLSTDPAAEVAFVCNICGTRNVNPIAKFHREMSDCAGCRSTPRFRGIIHVLSVGLFGSSMPLLSFPVRKDIRGIGMSEWEPYARILADRFSFQNTFFHTTPKLDITGEDWRNYTNQDFIICTEVFEHVLQPLSVGLENLRRMLSPRGVLVFSVPFTDAPETAEHFPGMTHFATCKVRDKWLVVGEQADGTYQLYDKNVFFHGGPGTVLEMRVFSQNHVKTMLHEAGFNVKIYDEPEPGIGYMWPARLERAGAGLSHSYLIAATPLT